MKGNHNEWLEYYNYYLVVINMSKIQNERKSQPRRSYRYVRRRCN